MGSAGGGTDDADAVDGKAGGAARGLIFYFAFLRCLRGIRSEVEAAIILNPEMMAVFIG